VDHRATALCRNGCELYVGRVALIDDDDLGRNVSSLQDRHDQLAHEALSIPRRNYHRQGEGPSGLHFSHEAVSTEERLPWVNPQP
jgi:hypothetical protein